MDKIDSFKIELENNEITVQNLQGKLMLYMCSEAESIGIDIPVELNKIEREINFLDNDLELIIYTKNTENHVSEALIVLDKAKTILKKWKR